MQMRTQFGLEVTDTVYTVTQRFLRTSAAYPETLFCSWKQILCFCDL